MPSLLKTIAARVGFALFAVQLASFFPVIANAESILQVLPTRVVLEGPKRSMTVTLINRGDSDGNYRMFFRNIRADDTGKFAEIVEPVEGEKFADKMVRFSPRRITVPARSKQSIRVVVRKPQGLDDGEYRSHLVFRKLPAQDSVLEEQAETNSVGFSLRPVVEVTIPVIVRHGSLSAEMSLADLKFIQTNDIEKSVEFTINRSGTRSLYGDVDVWWQPSQGEKTYVGMARGVAVYAPNERRVFQMPLDVGDADYGSGKLLLEFSEDPAYGGNLKAKLEKAI